MRRCRVGLVFLLLCLTAPGSPLVQAKDRVDLLVSGGIVVTVDRFGRVLPWERPPSSTSVMKRRARFPLTERLSFPGSLMLTIMLP